MKNMIGRNGLPMTDLIGQQHSLVGKWPMADRYIVLCISSDIWTPFCGRITDVQTGKWKYK